MIQEYNFTIANTEHLFNSFKQAELECEKLILADLSLPAYDQCLQASHLFNLLDARGVISATERQSYIGRIRTLAKLCGSKYIENLNIKKDKDSKND